jgi:hypothetical protein
MIRQKRGHLGRWTDKWTNIHKNIQTDRMIDYKTHRDRQIIWISTPFKLFKEVHGEIQIDGWIEIQIDKW